MKTLHVCDYIDPSLGGGTAERTFQLILALKKLNVSCSILCTRVGLSDLRRQELNGIPIHAVGVFNRRFLLPKLSPILLVRLVQEHDIIHITGHWSLLGALTCLVAWVFKKPYVYCPAGSLKVFGRSTRIKNIYNYLIGYRMVKQATKCLAITEQEKEQFEPYGIIRESVYLLPNGVNPPPSEINLDPYSFKNKLNLNDRLVILFLGRLSPIKGPDLLLSAFLKIADQCPECHLVFAGPMSELGESLIQLSLASSHSAKIHFTGYLTGEAKYQALMASDVLVIPSRSEAMSLVALEAGILGKPVLLTDQCGFNEVATIGGGWVVPVEEAALSQALIEIFSEREYLAQKGAKLKAYIDEHYTWAKIAQSALTLYTEILTIP